MASITSAGRMRDPDEFDYSVSHRAVPVPSHVPYHASEATQPQPSRQELPHPSRQELAGRAPPHQRDRDEASSIHTEGRRRGSFSFLRRSSSHSAPGAPTGQSEPAPPLPPPPVTRIAQAQQEQQHYRNASGEGSNMLRKQSKVRKAEEERMMREATARQQAQQQPMRDLPVINHLPSIDSFDNPYSTNNSSPSLPQHSGATANFSRPGNAAAMPSSNYNSSSSPAYALRAGNAFAAQAAASSSPSLVGNKGTNGEYVDQPVNRSESMTHRGRMSYASSTAQVNVNSPRRVRRRKDPTPFNVLVIGAKNSGKTNFISFLRHSLALPSHKQASDAQDDSRAKSGKSSFTSHYLETEMDGERIGVTLWDSAGLENGIIDLQLREMATFVESKFEETFVEEQKVMRSPGVKDTHIHCVFLVLDPVRLDTTVAASTSAQSGGAVLAGIGGLDNDLDLQVIRALWGKTTVIPVISKADTLTLGHMTFLKRAVWDSLKGAKLDPLEALELEGEEDDDDYDDEALDEQEEDGNGDVINNLEDSSDYDESGNTPLTKSKRTANNGHNRQSSLANTVASSANGDGETPYIPMSILSPDPYDLPPYTRASKTSKIGRRFPWGFADPYDPEHCDFTRLRDSIFSEWRGDLRDLARTKWYENWRTSRLKNLPGSKQRVRGGVTPVAAVPREGRTSPRSTRNISGGGAQAVGGAGAAVPRSVSGGVGGDVPAVRGANVTDGRSVSKAERMMGIGAGAAQDAGSVSSRAGGGNGTYRGVETYQ